MRTSLRATAALAVALLLFLASAPVSAHEERTVAGYDFVVGLIDEPVFVGQKSGLEFSVSRAGAPVEGLETTLTAEVRYGGAQKGLPLDARFGQPGWYESVFVPTAAGPYSFHIAGAIEGNAVDETFTSSPDGFSEVQEAQSAQFPVQFPAQAELVDEAAKGAKAADQLTIALVLGAAGLVAGLAALGVALAGRRRLS
ncbi:MAG: hypothetical protein QOH61_2205 [Chloroflexota bacterium]|nr:hypothetical protein [Chloroflexota bacterium]